MFKGSYVALITPFKNDGTIDFTTLGTLIEWHLHEGTDGLVICGTTGEGITLSEKEQNSILEFTLKIVAKRAPIIMGTGMPSTQMTVDKTINAKKAGADGCLVIVPYYNKPTEIGCLKHFEAINKVGLPTIVYHHPGRTSLKLSIECLKNIATLPSIIGIKDSSGDLAFIEALINSVKVPLISGDDIITYPVLQKGALGTISVIGNLIPREWKNLVRSALERNPEEALSLHKRFLKLNEALMLETNPQGIKYAMHLLGKCSSTLRLPLLEPVKSTRNAIEAALKALQFL